MTIIELLNVVPANIVMLIQSYKQGELIVDTVENIRKNFNINLGKEIILLRPMNETSIQVSVY